MQIELSNEIIVAIDSKIPPKFSHSKKHLIVCKLDIVPSTLLLISFFAQEWATHSTKKRGKIPSLLMRKKLYPHLVRWDDGLFSLVINPIVNRNCFEYR